jgi:hypothetical protein
MALSIIAYLLSASAASISKIFLQTPLLFQTPLLAQRENRVWILIGSPKRSGRSDQSIPVTVKHRLDKQPIVLGGDADMPFTAGQNILDPVPLIIPKGVAAHLSAPNQLTSHDTRRHTVGNRLIEDRLECGRTRNCGLSRGHRPYPRREGNS